jgi:hypothetical protein
MKKEHPILFSAPMVRAILDGRKTQTRRVVKDSMLQDSSAEFYDEDFLKMTAKCPFGIVGDLWVRETFTYEGYSVEDKWLVYRADVAKSYTLNSGNKWKPSIFMPRAASRITLEITEIRVERLCEISAADAISEGIDLHYPVPGDGDPMPIVQYKMLWDSINGANSWFKNPFVWAITFKRVSQ